MNCPFSTLILWVLDANFANECKALHWEGNVPWT